MGGTHTTMKALPSQECSFPIYLLMLLKTIFMFMTPCTPRCFQWGAGTTAATARQT